MATPIYVHENLSPDQTINAGNLADMYVVKKWMVHLVSLSLLEATGATGCVYSDLVLHIVNTVPAGAGVRQVLLLFYSETLTKLSVDAISSSSTVLVVEVSGLCGS